MPNDVALPSANNNGLEAVSKSGSYYVHARPEVLELVPFTAQKVLDVGCGAGGFSAGLKSRQSVEIHGVELVPQAAEHAKLYLDQVWNATIDEALPLLPEGYYDCIVVADVLEHLVDPWEVLVALKSKLAAGGRIIASIPNIQNWSVLSEVLQGKWDYQNEGILDRTHLRFFTRKSVSELFWSAGLRIAKITTSVHGQEPPAPLLKGLAKSGLSAKSLAHDGRTFQFLVDAELSTPSMPKVTIVVLNWNGKEDTLECLASVNQLDYQNYNVVVVDNSSTDDSVEAISEKYPDITLLQSGGNLGYAGGNNVGIRWALEHGSDYILLLNNDTVVSPDLLNAFINAEGFLPSGSILGAKIFFYDEPGKLWFAGGRWNSGASDFEHVGHGQPGATEFNRVAEVDYITGCALFASSDTFREVGLLDEQFFLSYEETDWCYRAKVNGHKCIVVPEAKLWHKISSSFGGANTPIFCYFMIRNKLLWGKKHLSRSVRTALHKEAFQTLRRILLPPLSLVNVDFPLLKRLLWSLSTWLKTLRRNLADPINQATLMALRDYYLGRFGNCPPKVRELSPRQKKA